MISESCLCFTVWQVKMIKQCYEKGTARVPLSRALKCEPTILGMSRLALAGLKITFMANLIQTGARGWP